MSRFMTRAFILLIMLGCALGAQATPIPFNTLSYVGTAVQFGTGARLTNNVDQGSDINPPAGAIWTPQPVPVGLGFVLSFEFRMSGGWGYPDPGDPLGLYPGGDGFAFVIQNSALGDQAIGRGAGGMGYMYIPNSLAVVFDTYQNASWYGDPSGNYVGVQTRGTDFNVPHHYCTNGYLYESWGAWVPCTSDPSMVAVNVSRPLNDGAIQTAEIIYNPGNLEMFLNSALLFSIPLDLETTLALQNNMDAYIGFTAGDRGAFQNHDILSEDYYPVPEQATWLLLASGLFVLGFAVRHRRAN